MDEKNEQILYVPDPPQFLKFLIVLSVGYPCIFHVYARRPEL